MPTTTEAHRASIGPICPVLVRIFNRKRRNSDPNRRRSQKCSTNKELTNWFVCMTLSVLYCLFVLLLTQCTDVEKLVGLKTAAQQDKEDIRELQEDRDNFTHRLDRIEKELDSLERLFNTAT